MTVTVTVPSTMSYDGTAHTYTDDSDPITGLDGGGHVERFVPAVKDVVSIAEYVTTQTVTNTTNVTNSQNWATLTTGLVSATDYSSKAYAIGGTGITSVIGSAKEWATIITTTVDGTDYSSKEWAIGTVAQSAKEWATSLDLVDGVSHGAKKYANDAAASANAAAQQANTLTATSTTNTVISTGSKTFTTQSGEQFIAGQFVTIAQNGTPSNFMYGQVTAYSTTQLTVNVTAIGGSGTITDWLISLSGLQGVQGIQGDRGLDGITTPPFLLNQAGVI